MSNRFEPVEAGIIGGVLRWFWNRTGNRIPLPVGAVIGIGTGMLIHQLTSARLPPSFRPAGWSLLVAGIGINALAVKERGVGDLEHPAELTSTPGLLVTMPLMFVRIHRSVLAEEQVLLERFGDEYTKYLAGVPRYLGPVLPPQKCP